MNSINLRRSAVRLMAASAAGYALSFAKELIVAWYFGAGASMDAYYAAMVLPNFAVAMFAFATTTIVLSTYVHMKSLHPHLANGFAKLVVSDVLVALAVLSALLSIFAQPVVRLFFPGLSSGVSAQAGELTRWLAWSAVFSGMTAVLTGFLQAEGRFSAPYLTGSIVTVFTLAAVLEFSRVLGVDSLVWGLLIGTILQLLMVVVLLARLHTDWTGPRLSWSHPAMKALKPFMGAILGVYALTEANTLVDRVMSSWLPTGSVAALGYSVKMFNMAGQILSWPIATVAFPLMAGRLARNDEEALREDFRKAMRLSHAIVIPVAAFLILFAEPIVLTLFQRGVFDARATGLVSSSLAGFCFSLPAQVPLLMLSRLAIAQRNGGLLLGIGVVGVLANAGLNLLLMRLFHPPVLGIALSTSLVAYLALLFYFFMMRREHPWLTPSLLGAGMGTYWIPTAALLGLSGLVWWAGAILGLERRLPHLIIAGVAGWAGFGLLAWRLDAEELKTAWQLLISRVRGAAVPASMAS